MRDNLVMSHLRAVILSNASAFGISGILVKQAYQPQAQGIESSACGYMHKISEKRMGMVARQSIWDDISGTMQDSQVQYLESLYQITVVEPRNTGDTPTVDTLGAADIASAMAFILQSNSSVAYLAGVGIGILKIDSVRNMFFANDRNQNQSSASFDVTVTHKEVMTSAGDVVNSYQVATYPI